jgi:hypothetical protein
MVLHRRPETSHQTISRLNNKGITMQGATRGRSAHWPRSQSSGGRWARERVLGHYPPGGATLRPSRCRHNIPLLRSHSRDASHHAAVNVSPFGCTYQCVALSTVMLTVVVIASAVKSRSFKNGQCRVLSVGAVPLVAGAQLVAGLQSQGRPEGGMSCQFFLPAARTVRGVFFS